MGRKSIKTDQEKDALVERLCERIEKGATLEGAMVFEDVNESTIRLWIAKEGKYLHQIARARENMRLRLVELVETREKGHAGPAWLLERMQPYRDDFRPPIARQELSGPNGAPLQIAAVPIRGIEREEMERAREIGAKLQAKALPKPS